MPKGIGEENVARMMSDPFYCLDEIDPAYIVKHEPLIDEDTFIKVGVRLINEIGAEEYLTHLLKNLKGHHA